QSLGPFPRKRIPPTARFSGGLTPRTPSKSASLLTSPRRAGLVPRPLPSNRSPHPSNWFTHWSLPPAKYSSPTTTTPIPDTLGAGAARQARVLARLSRAPERSRSARSPARWTKCTEAYGPRLWRGSAAGAVNVRGYLSTGAQRPFPEDWAKPKPEIGGRPGPLRFRRCHHSTDPTHALRQSHGSPSSLSAGPSPRPPSDVSTSVSLA